LEIPERREKPDPWGLESQDLQVLQEILELRELKEFLDLKPMNEAS
jgi:hypothetical protein